MEITADRVNNSVTYNNKVIELIERKLTIYKTSTLVNKRHPSRGYKEDITRMYNGLEAIKDTLATMNIELMINYNQFSATFKDAINNYCIDIKAR